MRIDFLSAHSAHSFSPLETKQTAKRNTIRSLSIERRFLRLQILQSPNSGGDKETQSFGKLMNF